MSDKQLFSIFKSGFNIDFSELCGNKQGSVSIHQTQFTAYQKLIAQLKKSEPDFIAAEFIYSPSKVMITTCSP